MLSLMTSRVVARQPKRTGTKTIMQKENYQASESNQNTGRQALVASGSRRRGRRPGGRLFGPEDRREAKAETLQTENLDAYSAPTEKAHNNGKPGMTRPSFPLSEKMSPRGTAQKPRVTRKSRGMRYKQVNNFLFNCMRMMLADSAAKEAVARKIEGAKDFLSANVEFVRLNIFTMTKFALVDQPSSAAIAALVWMVRNVLPSSASILREVVLSCNRVMPRRFGMLRSSNTEWVNEVRSCCTLFSYLVKEMDEQRSHYNPFLRIYSELLSNLLSTGMVENIMCFTEAIKVGGRVLYGKRKEDFEYMVVAMEHLTVVKWKEKAIQTSYNQLCELRRSWSKQDESKNEKSTPGRRPLASAQTRLNTPANFLEGQEITEARDEVSEGSIDHVADSITSLSL